MQPLKFLLYDASAGSGKTFTLTKSYLKILFKNPNPDSFKQILAITFTNKAVGEMKERIIENLIQFATPSIISRPNEMFKTLSHELSISPNDLHLKSKIIIKTILHNYASFNVSTIDAFTHRVIRTFAHDLKFSTNFDIELDQDKMISEAVDKLIAKAGLEEQLTKILVEFAIEKIDDDKSWDITNDFNKIARLLVNENHMAHISSFEDKCINDFIAFKETLNKEIDQLESKIEKEAKHALTLIEESGLAFDDFSRRSLPNHFLKLSNLSIDKTFDSVWQKTLLNGGALYPKRVDENIAEVIDTIQPKLIAFYNFTQQLVFKLKLKLTLKNHITPLSVINAIQGELLSLKEEQNKLLISEFNTIIYNEIKDQPTPFIYERLGERYRHFFIDEFQDTSVLQWANLQPLIDNSLSSNLGSLMLVGDAKQAIYRWRGGDADQFLQIIDKTNQPFVIEPRVEQLATNYRSLKEVVTFNNSLFSFIADHCFDYDTYPYLYKNYSQNYNRESQGFVNLNFFEITNAEDADEIYPEAVYNKINFCLTQGFEYGDICVLVRKRNQAVIISKFLNSQGLEINSAETLLLNNSEKVVFVLNLFYLLAEPENDNTKVNVLSFIADWLKLNDPHEFIVSNLNLPTNQIFGALRKFNINLKVEDLLQLTLYDLAETIIRAFNLVDHSDSYLQYLLDQILDYTKNNPSDIISFLRYFNDNKHKLSIVTPQNLNAIKIMTIHQSKGLEFPVVIYPYADTNIYEDKEPKVWFNIDAEEYNGFSSSLVSANKDLEHFGEQGHMLYNQYRSKLELDSINLLYVALTRAEQQLYIISKTDFNSNGKLNTTTYAYYFIQYLIDHQLWQDSKLEYSFGNPEKFMSGKESKMIETVPLHFISQSKDSHQLKIVSNKGLLWDTKQELAIERGNLIHLILAKIKTATDIDFVISEFVTNGDLTLIQAKELSQIITDTIHHPMLNYYFNDSMQILNEKEIIDKDGFIHRLDRLVITPNGCAVIIDYKTGSEKQDDRLQILNYAALITEMGYTIKENLLVYINHEIKVVKV